MMQTQKVQTQKMKTQKLLMHAAAAIGALFLLGFAPDRPEVPDGLKAPTGDEVILSAHATGVQIYVCQAESDQKTAWILKAPEADLSDATGKIVIHHSAGPSWKYIDGSVVTGKMVAKQDAPKPGAIPWLLVTAAGHTGDGMMARVTTIQRIHTEGGLPPKATDCTLSTNGKEMRSPYSADYYFYAPAVK
jgi:Protein of unknown function (DUF3455)